MLREIDTKGIKFQKKSLNINSSECLIFFIKYDIAWIIKVIRFCQVGTRSLLLIRQLYLHEIPIKYIEYRNSLDRWAQLVNRISGDSAYNNNPFKVSLNCSIIIISYYYNYNYNDYWLYHVIYFALHYVAKRTFPCERLSFWRMEMFVL